MMRMMSLVLVVAGLLCAVPQAFAVENYEIDLAHSNIGFSITHMMVSQVTGGFTQYEGTVAYDPNDLANSKVSVTVKTSSIDTRMAKRDDHLRNADFFDTEKFPVASFVSKKIASGSMTGDLTIKGVTKEVSVPITVSGPVKSPSGALVVGISGTFKINRQDYGIQWNKALDQGGVVLGDEVTITINVEAQKKVPA